MHQLERVTNLLTLLLSARRHVTFEEIRNELRGQYPESKEAARAAFERDKAVLRDEGVPIDQVTLAGQQAGQTGYRVLRSAYEIEDFDLTPDETAALRIAVGTIRLGTNWAQEALWKVDIGSGAEVATKDGGGESAIAVELPVDERLPTLHRAIADRRQVTFVYRSRERQLEPWGLLARDGWWYVIGHDHGHGERRTYRLDRIEGAVKIAGESTVDVPADFDPRTVFPNDPKLLPDSIDVGADDALVLVDASDAAVVIQQYGEEAIVGRRPDGSIEVRVPCSNVQAFVNWLLGFVERAEVLEPEPLRQLVIEWLVEAAGAS